MTNKPTAEELIAVEAMTKKSIASINEKKLLLRTKKEMYKNRFENDEGWRKADKEYKEAKLRRTQEKLRLLEEQGMKQLDADIGTIGDEIKEEQLALSDWLYNYQEKSGSAMIELDDGKTMLIQRKYSVKKESKAMRWLRTHREKEALQQLPGINMPTNL